MVEGSIVKWWRGVVLLGVVLLSVVLLSVGGVWFRYVEWWRSMVRCGDVLVKFGKVRYGDATLLFIKNRFCSKRGVINRVLFYISKT